MDIEELKSDYNLNGLNKLKTVDLASDIIYLCNKYNLDFDYTKISILLYLFIGFCLVNDAKEIKNLDELPKTSYYGVFFSKLMQKNNQDTDFINTVPENLSEAIKQDYTMRILEKTAQSWGRVSSETLCKYILKSPLPFYIKESDGHYKNIHLFYIYHYFTEMVENVLHEKPITKKTVYKKNKRFILF